jgi:N-methylhydantoinase B
MNNITIGGHISLPSPAHGRGPVLSRVEGTSAAGGPGEGSFAYYETIAGGAGASPARDGLDGVHTHMTNTLNTPVEALEMAYPFRVTEYIVRRGSGGPGRHRGGDGVTRTYEFLTDASVTLQTERRRLAPYGLNGGKPGTPGRNVILRHEGSGVGGPTAESAPDRRSAHPEVSKDERTTDVPIPLPSKIRLTVSPGDRLTIETPGGGGWGKPTRKR